MHKRWRVAIALRSSFFAAVNVGGPAARDAFVGAVYHVEFAAAGCCVRRRPNWCARQCRGGGYKLIFCFRFTWTFVKKCCES